MRNTPQNVSIPGAPAVSALVLASLVACHQEYADFPEIAQGDILEERIVALSEDCTPESCVQVIPLWGSSRIYGDRVDIQDDRFQIQYYCNLNMPGHRPILASTAALESASQECEALNGHSHLYFAHWWETTCFFNKDLQDPAYGSLSVPDYVTDFGDYLYVVCRPEGMFI